MKVKVSIPHRNYWLFELGRYRRIESGTNADGGRYRCRVERDRSSYSISPSDRNQSGFFSRYLGLVFNGLNLSISIHVLIQQSPKNERYEKVECF